MQQQLNFSAAPVWGQCRQAKASSHESHGGGHTKVRSSQQLLASSALNEARGNQRAGNVGGTYGSAGQGA
jgi:hypothetical protein